ncbi:MAG: hypothetical protein AAF658_07710, partial [Myxococcota bacterium]
RIEDNRLAAGEKTAWTVSLPPGYAELRVRVAHVRLTPANAAHMKRGGVAPELLKIWPEAAVQVRALEDHYPFLSWVAKHTWRDGRWREATPAELVAESKAMRGTSLATYESLLRDTQ